jgi:hypothetical protein
MAAIISNPQLVATPAPPARRYGLFTAAVGPLALDTHGVGSGVQFISDHCGGATLYDANCDTNPTKEFIEGSDIMAASPFWVVAMKRCGSVGRTAAELEQAIRQQLITGAQQQVEAAFWNGGGIGVTPALTTAGATPVVSAAVGFGARIAALEEAFYDTYGYVGTIHMNTRGYAAAAYADLLEGGSSGRLTTPIGSVWSIGSGYDITGPADAAPAAGNVWVFMTGQVAMWAGDVMVPDLMATFDRTSNQYNALAEQVYALTYDCPDVVALEVPIEAPMVVTAP